VKLMKTTSNRLSQLGMYILLMRIIMLLIFIFFSLIPFVSAINILASQFFSNNVFLFLLVALLAIILSIVTIVSIYTLNLDLRGITSTVFATGIVWNFDNPYLLVIGVVLCWLFYEFWYIFARFLQLDKEYSSYRQGSFERKRLSLNLRNQVISFLIIGWITISLSWIIMYLSTNYYFELGTNFGTLGIATSLTMITLVYLTQRYVLKQPARVELEN